MRKSHVVFLGAIGFLVAATPAWPWGCEGHQAVALLAKKHLQPAALKKIDDLLGTKPIDPKLPRFCGQQPDAMADVATWADDIRGKRPETAGWHFIDIPLSATDTDPGKFCPPDGCSTSALQNSLGVLRKGGPATVVQAEALMFVIHFAGDLHQPLHDATNGDRGGNCVPVAFFGKQPRLKNPKNPKSRDFAPNLHEVWDDEIIKQMKPADLKKEEWTAQKIADSLDERFKDQVAGWSAGQLEDWARDGHRIAKQTSYGQVSPVIPIAQNPEEPKRCDGVSDQFLALKIRLGSSYEKAAEPVVQEQLAKAGFRLARLLNEASSPGPGPKAKKAAKKPSGVK